MANQIGKFTTTVANQDILQLDSIKERIKERLGNISDIDYNRYLANKLLTIKFDIFFTEANQVSINNGIYNDLIGDTTYSTGDYVQGLQSLKIKNIGSATISFNII